MVDRGAEAGPAGMPPGPGLAALLDDVTLVAVPNDDILDILTAQNRQLAHEQARTWAAIDEVQHRRPFAPAGQVRRSITRDLDSADEIRAALILTRRAADTETEHAHLVVCLLPLVWQALDDGVIDRGRALVFTRHLPDLTDEQITRICEVLLPVAGGLTTGQLEERLRRLIIEIDPGYYEGRYRKALRDRKLVHYLDAEGAAVVCGTGLPVEEAATAMARVDQLARAARRAGCAGTLDQARADVLLALLDGSVHGLTRAEIIAALIARHARGDEGDPHPDGPDDSGPDDSDPDGGGPGASGPDDSGPDDPGPDGDGDQRVATHEVGIEIHAPITALLGEDERPGHIPGLGPVTASTARTAVARARHAGWRWAVVDEDGRLLTEGMTRRRPTTCAPEGPRGGIVELHITATDLHRLIDAGSAGPWAGVLADIAAQHAAQSRDSAARRAALNVDPIARFPGAALRRHVQIRDRTCSAPGCRAPATRADIDHTVDHAQGGRTVDDDLGPACRHDHGLKTRGRWRVRQPRPGEFHWTSPLGRTYRVRPEPLLPPPLQPVTREPERWFAEPADDTDRPLLAQPRAPRAPPAEKPVRPILHFRALLARTPQPDDVPPPF